MLKINNQQQCSNLIQISKISKTNNYNYKNSLGLLYKGGYISSKVPTLTSSVSWRVNNHNYKSTTTTGPTTTKDYNHKYLTIITLIYYICTYLYKSINLFNYFYLQFIIYSIITYILQLLYFTSSTLLIPNYTETPSSNN